MQDHDRIHQRAEIAHLMRRDHEQPVRRQRLGDHAAQQALRRNVEPVRRLVEQHELGLAREPEREQELLLLAVRERGEVAAERQLELAQIALEAARSKRG